MLSSCVRPAGERGVRACDDLHDAPLSGFAIDTQYLYTKVTCPAGVTNIILNFWTNRIETKRMDHKVFNAYVAGWPRGMECLTKIEKDPPLAMFVRACELQERCQGTRLRDLLVMPLQVRWLYIFVRMRSAWGACYKSNKFTFDAWLAARKAVGRTEERGTRSWEGLNSFFACVSHLTVDHASLSRRSTGERREGVNSAIV